VTWYTKVEKAAKIITVISFVGGIAFWAYENIATKADIQKSEQLYLLNLLEIRITQAEDSLRYLDDIRDDTGVLTSAQQRRYASKLTLKSRLIKEKDDRMKQR